jgi:hypothetical protein
MVSIVTGMSVAMAAKYKMYCLILFETTVYVRILYLELLKFRYFSGRCLIKEYPAPKRKNCKLLEIGIVMWMYEAMEGRRREGKGDAENRILKLV